jgi:hypothetical protein
MRNEITIQQTQILTVSLKLWNNLNSWERRLWVKMDSVRNYKQITAELVYKVMTGTEYFVSLYTSVVITEEYNVMVNSEELIGTTEYLTV